MPMTFEQFVSLASSDQRWDGVSKLPWGDRAFSERMLREHLSQAHDGASRRLELIERHVAWIHAAVLEARPRRVLDLACGPGLYSQRLAALGHECVGVDIAPAAIDYARAHASSVTPQPRYLLEDITALKLKERFDLAMIIHGEFNVFPRQEAEKLLRFMRAAIAPGGRVLLEAHRFGAVEAMGRRGRTWIAAGTGLFGDRPHLRLDESRWDPATARATNLNWVIDADTLAVTR